MKTHLSLRDERNYLNCEYASQERDFSRQESLRLSKRRISCVSDRYKANQVWSHFCQIKKEFALTTDGKSGFSNKGVNWFGLWERLNVQSSLLQAE